MKRFSGWLFIIFCFCTSFSLLAQPGGGGPGGGDDPDAGVPINGGLIYLLLSAILIGIHKLWKKKH